MWKLYQIDTLPALVTLVYSISTMGLHHVEVYMQRKGLTPFYTPLLGCVWRAVAVRSSTPQQLMASITGKTPSAVHRPPRDKALK